MPNPNDPLSQTAHRPWPLPGRGWVLRQRWEDLLFAHWTLPSAVLRLLLPPALEPDEFHGQTWVGVVPFRMTGVAARGLPPLPGASKTIELNVRTYVTHRGKPGIYFFSLDATNRLAVWMGREIFNLPYHRALMSFESDDVGVVYGCRRETAAGEVGAEFHGQYAPIGDPFRPDPGTLEHWLVERYCLYATNGAGGVVRTEIHHVPWTLRPATAKIEANTMARAAGIELPRGAPLLHFARALDVRIWRPKRVR